MTHDNDELIDPFITWLDAYVAGKSTPANEAETDAELLALQATVRQFHGLDERLAQHAVFVAPRPPLWEEIMTTQTAIVPGTGSVNHPPAHIWPIHRRHAPDRRWEQAMSVLLIAAVIVASSIGIWRLAGNPGIGGTTQSPAATLPFNGSGDGGSGNTNSLAPIATATSGQESSSFPYPKSDECVIEPMTRAETLQHLQAANVATEPEIATYQYFIEPSEADSQAIMQVFREWQACNQRGPSAAHMLQFETPWFTANQFALFLKEGRPLSEAQLEEAADLATTLDRPDLSMYGSTPVYDVPMDKGTPPAFLPLPEGATPVASGGGGGYYQSIFADDIAVAGPDYVIAKATWVNSQGEIGLIAQVTWTFVKIDGEWKINEARESGGGGQG